MIDLAHRVRPSSRRGGVSILEFFGCTSALVGGVVLGSMYLGADVKEMAYIALERANLVEPRPSAQNGASAPAGAAGETIIPEAAPPADDEAVASDGSQREPADSTAVVTAGGSQASDKPSAPPPASTGFFARADLITDEQRKVLTLAYWESLGACMNKEVATRVSAIDRDGNWQLFDYLTGRKEGHRKAADAIAALDARGVDDSLLAYAKKAQAWHEDGAKLFARAVDLLTDAPTAQLSGPFAQSWQSAATQHKMEARLLTEKHEAVRTYLSHAYEDDSPAPPALNAR